MTRQDAKRELELIKSAIEWDYPLDGQIALDIAIEALEQEPKRGHWQQAKDVEIEYAVCTNCKHHGEFYMDYCPNCGSYNGGEKKVYSQIKDIPSGTQRCEKWIPVSERLPEEGLTVLILAENGRIEFGQRDENKWEWLAESIADYWTEAEEVIAWQPLPEPYTNSN